MFCLDVSRKGEKSELHNRNQKSDYTHKINQTHQQELKNSGIDLELAAYCFESWKGTDNPEGLEEALNRLNINTNRLQASEYAISQADARKINHLYYGGWWFESFNEYYHLKPNKPRKYFEKQYDNSASATAAVEKIIKYEAPRNTPPHILFPKYLPYSIAIQIAKNEKLENSFIESFPIGLEVISGKDFVNWVAANPIRIFITEGIKKCVSILSCGFMAISLSAGIWSGVPNVTDDYGNKVGEELLPELARLCQISREWVIVFDQDIKQKTQLAVSQARSRLIKNIKLVSNQNNNTYRILKWSALYKGIDDYLGSQKKPASSFKDLLNSGQSYIEASRLSYYWDLWHKNQDISQYTEKYGIKINQPYFDINLIPKDKNLIFLKGNQGTGKTYLMAEIANKAMRVGEKILVLSHRRKLGQAICEAMGIKWVDNKREENDYPLGIGICIDSLKANGKINFNPDEWKGCYIFLDEIVQFLNHLFNADTEIRKYRNLIIINLTRLLNDVIANNGKIVLGDADLDCDTIKFILSILKNVSNLNPFIIENTYQKANGTKVYFCPSQEEPVKIAYKNVSKNLPVALLVDGQQASTKWGSQTLETFFKAHFPDKRILRYDSETVGEKGSVANKIGVNFNEFKNFDIVILTNVLQTGASIELGDYFLGGIYLISNNVLDPTTYNQFLARDRSKVNRYCYVSLSDYKDYTGKMGSAAFSARKILEDSKNLFKSQIKAIEISDRFFDENSSIDEEEFVPHSLNYWSRQKARENLLRQNPRYSLEMLLKNKGWDVCVYNPEEEDNQPEEKDILSHQEIKKKIKSAQTDNVDKYNGNILQAKEITSSKYEELKKADSKTAQELYSQTKHEVKQAYGECSEITLKYYKKGKIKSHKRLYHYLRGTTKQRDEKVLEQYLEDQGRVYFYPDIVRRLSHYQLEVLNEMLNIKQYFDSGFVISSFDKRSEEYFRDFFQVQTRERVVEDKFGKRRVVTERISKALIVKELFGLNFKESECENRGWIYIIQRILSKIFDVKMKSKRIDSVKVNGKRKQIREYRGIDLERDYQVLAEAFNYWDRCSSEESLQVA